MLQPGVTGQPDASGSSATDALLPTDTAGATTATLAQFLHALTLGRCLENSSCGLYLFDATDSCLNVHMPKSLSAKSQASLDAGRMKLDPILAGKCVAAAANACATPNWEELCRAAFVPQVANGGACSDKSECIGGECTKGSGCFGVCKTLSNCDPKGSGHCPAGLRCLAPAINARGGSDFGSCGPAVAVGKLCHGTSDCVAGSSCVLQQGTSETGICGHGKIGDKCTNDQFCGADLQCHAGACAAFRAAGELCAHSSQCASGLACLGATNAGKCAVLAPGDPCSNSGKNCGPNLVCNKTCGSPAKVGEDCGPTTVCPNWQAECQGGKCKSEAGPGASVRRLRRVPTVRPAIWVRQCDEDLQGCRGRAPAVPQHR